MMRLFNRNYLKTFRKHLRSNLTPGEAFMWLLLKSKKLNGLKFRRQHGIGRYIVDFYCPKKKIAIELDGSSHNGREEYDYNRDLYIQKFGVTVLRFKNHEVFNDTEGVLEAIRQAGRRTPPSLRDTSPQSGEDI